MGLIELTLGFYFTLLFVRALVPDAGQIAFNPVYQTTVRLTRPVIDPFQRVLPARLKASVPVLLMVLIVAIQGVLYLWAGPSSRRLDLLVRGWTFTGDSPLWAPAKSVVVHLVLLFRLLAFAGLVLALQRPEDSYDQVSRLFREALRGMDRLPGKTRFAVPAILGVLFALLLALLWKICRRLDLLPPEPGIVIQSFIVSAALVVGLSSVFVFLIFVRAVISWLPLGGVARAGARWGWLESVTDPLIAPFQRLNLRAGGWDFTPLAAIFALTIVRRALLIGLSALQKGAAGS